jgi:hypothetical protein
MTLDELSDLVVEKVGTTDDESRTVAKLFLRRRYKMIWDAFNWSDAMAMVSVTSSTSHPYLFLPEGVSRVVSIRNASNSVLSSMDLNTLFAASPDFWDTSGTPVGFTHAAPAVAGAPAAANIVWNLSGYNNAEATDPGEIYFQGVFEDLDGDTHEVKSWIIDDDDANLLESFWVLSFSVSFNTVNTVTKLELREGTQAGTLRYTFFNPANDQTDRQVTTYPFDNGNTPAASVEARRRCRIRLMKKPDAAVAYLALCKRSCPSLDEDFHTANITDIDNVLIDFAQGDMLQRQRQYGKAQLIFAEADRHLKIRIEQERSNSGHAVRIVPAIEPMPFNGGSFGPSKSMF